MESIDACHLDGSIGRGLGARQVEWPQSILKNSWLDLLVARLPGRLGFPPMQSVFVQDVGKLVRTTAPWESSRSQGR